MKKFSRKEKLMTSDEFDQIINSKHIIGKKIIFVDKNIFSEKISFNTYSFKLESDDPSQYNIYNLNSLSFSEIFRNFDDENMERSNQLYLNYIEKEKRIDFIESHLYLGKRLLIIFNIELNIIVICSYGNFSDKYNYHTMNMEIVLKYDELDIKEVENVKYEMNFINNLEDYLVNKYIILSGKDYFIFDEKLNNKGITLYFNNNLKKYICKEKNKNFFDIRCIKRLFQFCLLSEEKNKMNENNLINNKNYKIVKNENFFIENRSNNQSNQNNSGISVNNDMLINLENNENNNQVQINNNNFGENNEINENNEEGENNYNNNLENIEENNNQNEQMEQENNFIEVMRNNLNPNSNRNTHLRIEPNNDNNDNNENLFRNIRENNNNINMNAENNILNENLNNMQNNIFNQRMENNINYENTGNVNNIFPNYNINNNQNNNNFNNNHFMGFGPHFYPYPHYYYNPYNPYNPYIGYDIPPRNNNNNNQTNCNNHNGNNYNGMSGSNHIDNSRINMNNFVDRVIY